MIIEEFRAAIAEAKKLQEETHDSKVHGRVTLPIERAEEVLEMYERAMSAFADLEASTEPAVKELQDQNFRYRAALQYIVDHADFAERPKWGNEFVDAAREALNGERLASTSPVERETL